jgi:carbamoyltransferase
MRILGISAFYHDSAAALVVDGEIVGAAQEERFTRRKHDARFPEHAVRYCLEAAGTDLEGIDHVVFYDKPFIKFERLLETYLATAPRGFQSFRMALPVWIKEKLFQKSMLRDYLKKLPGGEGWNRALLFTEHHQSHAASAFFPSPFSEAVVLTMDGVGEWIEVPCVCSASPRFTTTARLLSSRTAISWLRRRKSASRARSTIPDSLVTPSSTV